MANYDLRCLSPLEFETLIRDLFQEKMNITLESFTVGRDEGIDLRYLTGDGEDLIIQCKHYIKSTYSQLYSNLKKEAPKVRNLNPKRYILVTSVGLTPKNKNELKSLFEPYCKMDSDILGIDDILNLLNLYENIVKRNYKLWFTSTIVLENIIYSENYNKTQIDIENFQNFLPKLVVTNSFDKLEKILEEKNVCIICGIPGSGKTTMMKFLLMKHIERGYQPIMITENISEVYKMYHPERKQIFYYDDFLGQTFLEENFQKNEDSLICSFINRISSLKNKKFILSTREYILNQAEAKYEKIKAIDIYKYTINIADLSSVDKAKILYNHIWYSEIGVTNIDELLEDKNYMKIVKHRNFSPRIIEWMTVPKNVNSKYYINTFIKNLENPFVTWGNAFESQISEYSRVLLLILGTFPAPSRNLTFDTLWDAFLNYYSSDFRSEPLRLEYKSSLKELDGTFIRSYKSFNEIVFYLHNPSIRDFIHSYLLSDEYHFSSICKSAVSFLQIVEIWNIIKNNGDLNKCTKYIDFSIYLKKIDELFEDTKNIDCNKLLFEDKLYLLLEIASTIHDAEYVNYGNDKIKLLIKMNYDSKTNLRQLYNILILVNKNELLFSVYFNELLSSSKYAVISKTPKLLDDFVLITRFIQETGIVFNEKEMMNLKNRLILILNKGFEEDDEGGVFMYDPELDNFDHIGDGIEALEEINSDLDSLSELFGPICKTTKIYIEKKIEDYYSNYEPDWDNKYEETKITDYEKREEFEIDDLFESLKDIVL